MRSANFTITIIIGYICFFSFQPSAYANETFSYDIPELDEQGIYESINQSNHQYTLLYCYNFWCGWCKKKLVSFKDIADNYDMDFCVMLTNRATDSLFVLESKKEIQAIDSTISKFCVLSDSYYETKLRDRTPMYKRKGLFLIYNGRKEGNKYIRFIEQFIPEGFNNDPCTPKMIVIKKNEGIVFVNEGNKETLFSEDDRQRLEHVLTK